MSTELSSATDTPPITRDSSAEQRWWPRYIAGIALAASSLVLASVLDPSVYAWCSGLQDVEGLRLFRSVPAWFGEPAGVVLLAAGTWAASRSDWRSLVLVLLGVVLAAGASAGLKQLIGRERPKHTNGETVLRGPVWPRRGTPSPSFPSSHTTVAFALACGLTRISPRGRYVFLALAVACGISRVLSESHFLSDTVAGAWLGWVIACLAWRITDRRNLRC